VGSACVSIVATVARRTGDRQTCFDVRLRGPPADDEGLCSHHKHGHARRSKQERFLDHLVAGCDRGSGGAGRTLFLRRLRPLLRAGPQRWAASRGTRPTRAGQSIDAQAVRRRHHGGSAATPITGPSASDRTTARASRTRAASSRTRATASRTATVDGKQGNV
jgi:hypothetical protein